VSEQKTKTPEAHPAPVPFLAELKAFIAAHPVSIVAKAIFELTRENRELDSELYKLTAEELRLASVKLLEKYAPDCECEQCLRVRAGKGEN